jgi:integrase
LGRLINTVDAPHWSDKRDAALINVMAHAGLRIYEALALKIDDFQFIESKTHPCTVCHVFVNTNLVACQP